MSLRKILFVDDEPMVLSGLKRMLHRYGTEWEMFFAEGAIAALKIMRSEKIEVLVTDMRMPGMDGFELLTIVKNEYPGVVRMVLSGHSERETIVKTATLAHQFLTKPCSSEQVKEAIDRTLRVNRLINNENARRVLSEIEALPTVPALYNRIMAIIESPEGSLAEVSNLVAQDLGISANILKQVNSSFWGLAQKVTTPEMAVRLLGGEIIRSLVLSSHILRSLPASESALFSPEKLMKQSLLAARLGRELAIIEGMSKSDCDSCSIGGLFHDIGELILNSYFPKSHIVALETAHKHCTPIHDAEQEVLGVNHPELGAYLLGLWGMPLSVVEAVALHHCETTDVVSENPTIVLIVHAVASALDNECTVLTGFPSSLEELIDLGNTGRSARWLKSIKASIKETRHE